MADNVTTYTTVVDVNVKGEEQLDKLGQTTDEAAGAFTRLQRQIRDTNVALQKAAESGDKATFNKLKAQLDDLEDKLEVTTLKSKQFEDALATMPGPAGAAGNAIKAVDGGLKALIANPVVATIAAIVGIFLLFKKSLESTAEGQQTLNRISEAFGKILGPILALVEKVALPIFEGFAVVIEKVAGAFSYFAQKLGVSKTKIDEASSGIKDFKKHNEDLAKQQKDAADKAAQASKERAAAAKKAADDKKKELEEIKKKAQDEININESLKESEDKLQQARTRILDDRIKQLNQEQEFADANYQREVKRINDLLAVERTTEEERKKLITEKNNLEAQYITDKQNRDKAITDENTKKAEEAKKKDEEDKKKKEEDDKLKLEQETQLREDKANRVVAEYEFMRAMNQATFQDELNAYDQTRALERQNLEANKASQDALIAFDKATAAQRIQIERAQQETKLAIISDALGTIADAVGRESAAGKALAVAQATINTYMGASKALATYPPPWGAIAAGTVIVAGLLQVKKIMDTKLPPVPKPGGGTSSAGSSGGGSNTPAMAPPQIPSMQVPGITTTGGTNPTQQIANTLAQSSQKPIQAYVVSGQVSSQQALDRRTTKAATF